LSATSQGSGPQGHDVTSRKLRDRLEKEKLINVSIRVEPTDSADAFKVSGRGELQLAILIEMMRREGFELQVSRPEIVTKDSPAGKLEPVGDVVIDVPEEVQGVDIAAPGLRKGHVTQIVNKRPGHLPPLIAPRSSPAASRHPSRRGNRRDYAGGMGHARVSGQRVEARLVC